MSVAGAGSPWAGQTRARSRTHIRGLVRRYAQPFLSAAFRNTHNPMPTPTDVKFGAGPRGKTGYLGRTWAPSTGVPTAEGDLGGRETRSSHSFWPRSCVSPRLKALKPAARASVAVCGGEWGLLCGTLGAARACSCAGAVADDASLAAGRRHISHHFDGSRTRGYKAWAARNDCARAQGRSCTHTGPGYLESLFASPCCNSTCHGLCAHVCTAGQVGRGLVLHDAPVPTAHTIDDVGMPGRFALGLFRALFEQSGSHRLM